MIFLSYTRGKYGKEKQSIIITVKTLYITTINIFLLHKHPAQSVKHFMLLVYEPQYCHKYLNTTPKCKTIRFCKSAFKYFFMLPYLLFNQKFKIWRNEEKKEGTKKFCFLKTGLNLFLTFKEYLYTGSFTKKKQHR